MLSISVPSADPVCSCPAPVCSSPAMLLPEADSLESAVCSNAARSCFSSELSAPLSGAPGLPRVICRARDASDTRPGCDCDSTSRSGIARGWESAVLGCCSWPCFEPSPDESALWPLSSLPAAFCSVCCVSAPFGGSPAKDVCTQPLHAQLHQVEPTAKCIRFVRYVYQAFKFTTTQVIICRVEGLVWERTRIAFLRRLHREITDSAHAQVIISVVSL